ncbi:MAG: prolyl oligopeptidase family serine peptidase [Verrucomicrobiales bacterium]|nr:prolyl oligopeptidase family serine peptidase [Verrucomicrobiales bacterium]
MRKTLVLLVAAGITALTAFPAEPAPGQQVEQSLATSDGGSIPYLIYLPANYADTRDKVPMILFLHGRGESNGPLSLVAKWGPPRRLAAGEPMKYLVVSPQCPRSSFWSADDQQQRLLELLAHIKKNFRVDEDRIYLTGLSMGGFGTWRLAADHPEMFAAAAPICGRGNPETASRLTKLPIWAWHGTDDPTVPVKNSIDMVEAIQAAGGTKVRFTSLEYIGHASWQAAYQSADLYAWFDKQRASQNQ